MLEKCLKMFYIIIKNLSFLKLCQEKTKKKKVKFDNISRISLLSFICKDFSAWLSAETFIWVSNFPDFVTKWDRKCENGILRHPLEALEGSNLLWHIVTPSSLLSLSFLPVWTKWLLASTSKASVGKNVFYHILFFTPPFCYLKERAQTFYGSYVSTLSFMLLSLFHLWEL